MMLRAHDAAQRGGIIAKLLVLLIVVLLCFVIYVVRAPLLRVAGNFWITPQPPAACDVIVILSDDDFTSDRASRAAELYHAGWAPTIFASGRRLRPYASIAELMQKDLEARGVPAKAIVAYPHDAVDTLIELTDVRGLVQQHGWKRVMIVTSNFHTRRTRYLCRHIFPADIKVLVESAPDVNYDPDSWWRTRGGLKIFFHEAVGMVVSEWEVHHQKPNSAEVLLFPSIPPIVFK
ncbi:MAG TPA: YdcF family protein [Candidatus Acidoferrales bacterium]|nr:YdcF family protein [Candidatus Acidoferrales bacterium]